MSHPPEIHPLVLKTWEMIGFQKGVGLSGQIDQAQLDYRSGTLGKEDAREKIIKTFLEIHHATHVEPELEYAQEKIALPYNARIVTPGTWDVQAADVDILQGAKRIATPLLTTMVGCVVHHPNIGAGIALHDMISYANLVPAIDIVLDRPTFNIVEKLYGPDQHPMYDWVSPERFAQTIEKTISDALTAFLSIAKEEFVPNATTLGLLGIEPWDGIEPLDGYEALIRQVVLAFVKQYRRATHSAVALPIDLSFLHQEVAVIYGGRNDPNFSTPKLLRPST